MTARAVGVLAGSIVVLLLGAALVPVSLVQVLLVVAAVVLFGFLLLRWGKPGIKLFASIVATGPAAAAVLWHSGAGLARIGLFALTLFVALLAYRSGILVWPDVAILFLAGLALFALRDEKNEKPMVQPPPALASFDLPASAVKPPTMELTAPAKVEIIAVTPTRRSTATHKTSRFDALLLTRVPRAGPSGPVRFLVSRGKGDSTVLALARHRVDSTEFFLLPSADCFFAPPEYGLSPGKAEAILEAYGFPERSAQGFASSFSGVVDYVHVNPGKSLKRYFSGDKRVGSFLTATTFRNSKRARAGLHLPGQNRATRRQSVRALEPTMTLRGGIKGGNGKARQFIVLRQECFDFGPGRPVPAG
jgi:hypothetical protein